MKSSNTIIKLITPIILLFVLWGPGLARSQAAPGTKTSVGYSAFGLRGSRKRRSAREKGLIRLSYQELSLTRLAR